MHIFYSFILYINQKYFIHLKINNGLKCPIYWFGLIVTKNNHSCWAFLSLDINFIPWLSHIRLYQWWLYECTCTFKLHKSITYQCHHKSVNIKFKWPSIRNLISTITNYYEKIYYILFFTYSIHMWYLSALLNFKKNIKNIQVCHSSSLETFSWK